MSLAILAGLFQPAQSVAEGPADPFAIVELPFKVTAMRGPGSEVALSVATSGLLPIAHSKPVSSDPKASVSDEPEPAQIVVVWGEGGGAVLGLTDGALRTTLLSAEAVEGLAASELARGAAPGYRRALDGPLSAYLSGPTRGPHGQAGHAAGLTIRERQKVDRSADPKPVPITTTTVTPGNEAMFAGRSPRIATIDGRRVVLAVTTNSDAASSLVLIDKDGEGHWQIRARAPTQAGEAAKGAPLAVAAVADFMGSGKQQVALVQASDGAGKLQLWSYSDGALALVAEKPGFAEPPAADVELAAAVPNETGAAPDLALPVGDRGTLAILTPKDGFRERSRSVLPAPAALGIAALGRGSQARLLVGMADGRIAIIPLQRGTQP